MKFFINFLLIISVSICINNASAITIVSVSGGTGAGKTTVVKKIKEVMGDNIQVLSQDSYYKNLSHLSLEDRKNSNFDCPAAIDFDLLKEHLLKLKNGHTVEVPSYDFTTHNRTDELTTAYPKDIIIVEGILLLAMPEIRELADIKVFLDVPSDERILRRISRDINERGRNLQDAANQYLTTVKPMHQKYVAPSKEFADIIIPRGAENNVAIECLVSELNSHLENDDVSYNTASCQN